MVGFEHDVDLLETKPEHIEKTLWEVDLAEGSVASNAIHCTTFKMV